MSSPLGNLLDNLFIYVAVLDRDGVIREINRAPLDRSACRREQVLGLRFCDTPWWAGDAAAQARIAAAIDAAAAGRTQRFDIDARMGAETVPVDFQISPVRDEDGGISGMVAIAVDISERKRAEREMASARTRFETILRTAGDGIHVLDRNGVLVEANDAFLTMLGLDRAAVGRVHLSEWEANFSREQLDRRMADILRSRDPMLFETQHRRRDGSVVEVEVACNIIDIDGEPYLYAASRDIGARKAAERQRRRDHALLMTIIDTTPACVFWKDRDLHYLGCNTAFARDAGFSRPDELIGRTDFDMGWRDQAELYRADDRRVIDTGMAKLSFDEPQTTPDGRRIWLRTSKVPLRDPQTGVIIGVLGVYEDITERKRAEQGLRESEAIYRAIIDAMPVPCALNDGDGRIVLVNRAFERTFGYRHGEIPTLADWWPRAYPDPAYREAVGRQWAEHLARATASGEDFEPIEVNIRCRDGRVRTVVCAAVTLGASYAETHLVTMFDITEQRHALDELQQHRDRLEDIVIERSRKILELNAQLEERARAAEEASLAKSRFLANMSHEIRTPLNAIAGMSHLIRRGGLTPVQGGQLDKLEAASRHLLETIDAILDLSKIEAGKLVLESAPLTVAGVVDNVVTMLQHAARAKQLELRVDLPPLPGPLLGDATRLQQALLNYAANAVKFTEAGSVTLRVSVVEAGADDLLLRFEVIDSGVGIAAEDLGRLFGSFEQVDNSTTRKYGGTGLGLAITREIARLMGGTAGAESQPGAGSRFWFTARLARGDAAAANVDADAETALRHRHAGARILVVEDEPVNREIAAGLLEDTGLAVDLAADGVEAVERARATAYDLILMDMQMPRLNGLDATREIRRDGRSSRRPIIAMTANAFSEDRRRCLDAGMDDFMAKPVRPEALFATVLAWLDRSRPAR